MGRLKVGDHVTTYDSATGTTSPQTVLHVWIIHDHDRLDVTLRVDDAQHAPQDLRKTRTVLCVRRLVPCNAPAPGMWISCVIGDWIEQPLDMCNDARILLT